MYNFFIKKIREQSRRQVRISTRISCDAKELRKIVNTSFKS
jgi:hypothetical protein